jgi:predicted Zn finger-like uncharacterized protein/prepilin-type processing-associated H-X9-DG protein
MSIKIQCPHCRQSYDLTPDQAPAYSGQTITCTTCSREFDVPVLSAGQRPIAHYASPRGHGQSPQNGMAIAALVLGILGFCLPLLASIPAIIFGILGIRQANQPDGNGRGMAIAGLVLGCVSMVFMALPLAVMLPALNSAKERANRVKCASNLRQIGMAMALYSNEHRGQLPPNVQVMVTEMDLGLSALCCPSSTDDPASTPGQLGPGTLSYIYIPFKSMNMPASIVVAHEPLENHDGEGMNVLFMDGHVEWFNRAEAQQLLQDLAAGRNPPTGR